MASNYLLPTTYYILKRGISLPEIIVSFGIVAVISFLVGSIYIAHFRLFSNQNTALDVSTQNKLALEEISNQIRQAESVVANCTPCGSDTTDASILILRLWPIDNNGDPIDPAGSNYDYIEYKRDATDNTKLVRITYPYASSSRQSGTHAVAISLSNLTFTYDNATPSQAAQVTVAVTTTVTTGNKVQTTTESAKADLRNK